MLSKLNVVKQTRNFKMLLKITEYIRNPLILISTVQKNSKVRYTQQSYFISDSSHIQNRYQIFDSYKIHDLLRSAKTKFPPTRTILIIITIIVYCIVMVVPLYALSDLKSCIIQACLHAKFYFLFCYETTVNWNSDGQNYVYLIQIGQV